MTLFFSMNHPPEKYIERSVFRQYEISIIILVIFEIYTTAIDGWE